MAGELGQKQFIDNEVKPMVRQTIPEILDRLQKLENGVGRANMTAAQALRVAGAPKIAEAACECKDETPEPKKKAKATKKKG